MAKEKKKIPALNPDIHLHLLQETATFQHPLEHLGHGVNLCLAHGDLKSLAANDYLC